MATQVLKANTSSPKGPGNSFPLLTLTEFETLWESLDPETIETAAAFRKANRLMGQEDVKGNPCQNQMRAPYGRTLAGVTDIIFQILRLNEDDTFLDIGHGLGNTAFQAALCRGCQAIGVELVKHRFKASQEMQSQLAANLEDKQRKRIHEKVELRHGCFADPELNAWLKNANKVYVNNYGDNFDEIVDTDPDGRSYTLNDYVAGVLASLEIGSLMVTLSDLNLAAPSLSDANSWRVEQGLEPSPHASFYEVVKVSGLGETWESFLQSSDTTANNQQPAHLFVYRRV